MDLALAIYIVLCFVSGLMWLESNGYQRWRWSIADLLKVTLLASVMLALGRVLASV